MYCVTCLLYLQHVSFITDQRLGDHFNTLMTWGILNMFSIIIIIIIIIIIVFK